MATIIFEEGDTLYYRDGDGNLIPAVKTSGNNVSVAPLSSNVNLVKFGAAENGSGGLQIDGNQVAVSLPKLPVSGGVITVKGSDNNLYDIAVTPHS